MKILLLCHKMPYPLHDGGAYSSYNTSLGLASQNVNIKVLAINTPRNWIDIDRIPDDFVEKTKFESSKVDTRFKPFSAFLNLFCERSYFVERFFSEKFNTDLISLLEKDNYDIIHLEHIYLSLYINTIRKHSKAAIVLRPQNVENQVWKRVLNNNMQPVKKAYLRLATKRLEKYEMEVSEKVDGIIAISPGDAETFKIYAPKTPIVEVPVGFDFNTLNSYDFNKQFTNFPVFYHLGSMDWHPNIQGIKWFIEEVIPVITKDYPEFEFRVAGKKMPRWIYKYQSKNLVVDGEVKDALKYHEDKAIMIVPLLSGGGLRVKIIEGMAFGKTIISTTIGAEGIAYTVQQNILIANDAETFATQIKRCMGSKEFCKNIGKQAQKLALENYDYKKTAEKMISFYKKLI